MSPLISGGSSGGSAGREIGYDQITASVTAATSTEASGTTVITCAARVFDGGAVVANFSAPFLQPPQVAAGDTITVCLFEGATQIGRLCVAQNNAAAATAYPCAGSIRFTPTAASHTYTVTCFWGAHAGGAVGAGAGGTGAYVPAYIRFTKV